MKVSRTCDRKFVNSPKPGEIYFTEAGGNDNYLCIDSEVGRRMFPQASRDRAVFSVELGSVAIAFNDNNPDRQRYLLKPINNGQIFEEK